MIFSNFKASFTEYKLCILIWFIIIEEHVNWWFGKYDSWWCWTI